MRAIRSLLLLGLALGLAHHFTAGAPLVARATLALGTVVLLAELAGRVAGRWGAPRVAAFVATGLLCSPALIGVVRPDEVQALVFLRDAALALFVVRAGLGTRQEVAPASPLGSRYLVASLVAPLLVTTTAVYALHRWFPLTIHQPLGDALAVGLVLGALAAVAAPALTWTTLNESPGGPLPNALLRLNVQREFAAVLLVVAALAAARGFASPGALEPRVFLDPLVSLGEALAAGAVLAWLASRYLTVLDGDPGVFLVALAFGVAVAVWTGRAEVTLAALVTGLLLARLDRGQAERLRSHFDARGIGLAAATFALVGLTMDGASLLDLWPWILLVAFARLIGLLVGEWLGARPRRTTGTTAGRGWLGLVSQGGLGLSLAAVARRAFPEWGVSFESFVVGLVAIHAVVGPICLRWVVARPSQPLEGASGGT